MENASKALLIAGGIMLTMLVVSILLYSWTALSEYQAEQDRLLAMQELTKFNLEYTNYNREDVQGYELLSLVNKVIDYNQTYSDKGVGTSSSVGNIAQYRPITISIKIDSSSGSYTNRDKFTGSITVPAVARTGHQDKAYDDIQNNTTYSNPIEKIYNKDISGYNSSYRLFKLNTYTQSDTVNQFANILNTIHTIEDNFGGSSNAQNLTKSIGTIFSGKVIDYNGQPTTDIKSWFQQNYIENRYKTLTGKNLKLDTGAEKIRDTDNIKRMLQYYEYMEFKKAMFKCTGIDYDDGETGEYDTGRVIGISFEIVVP